MNILEITGLEQIFLGWFLIFHGLIHLIFLIYNYDEKTKVYTGWARRSWLLDKVIPPPLLSYIGIMTWILIMILFVGSGLGVLDLIALNEYLPPLIILSSTVATIAFIIFYNGLAPTPFHWILGVIIDVTLIIYVIVFPQNGLLVVILLLLITGYGMLFHSKILAKLTPPQA